MDSVLNREYKKLVDELTQGLQKSIQLRDHICSTSPSKAQDLLLREIISTFENALSILKSAAQFRAGTRTPAIPESSLSQDASPKSEHVDINFTVCPDHADASTKRKLQPTRTQRVRIRGENLVDGPPDDGHCWRKYGQKDILGAKHPRSYYRCTYRTVRNCWATKKVQRSDDDPTLFEIVYKGTHTCRQPSYAAFQATTPPQQQQSQTLLDFTSAKGPTVETEDLSVMKIPTQFSFPTTFSGTEREKEYSPFNEYRTSNYSPIFYNPETLESDYIWSSSHLKFPTEPFDEDPSFMFY